jgi:rubrerythrin
MPVDPLSLFVLPLTLALAAVFAAAAAYDFIIFRRRRRKNGNEAVYRCNACRHIYTVSCRTPLARCPKCGHQNEPVRA